MLTNNQTFSDVIIWLAFYMLGLNHMFYIFIVLTEVLWRNMIQLLWNKTTPHFQLLSMSKVDRQDIDSIFF